MSRVKVIVSVLLSLLVMPAIALATTEATFRPASELGEGIIQVELTNVEVNNDEAGKDLLWKIVQPYAVQVPEDVETPVDLEEWERDKGIETSTLTHIGYVSSDKKSYYQSTGVHKYILWQLKDVHWAHWSYKYDYTSWKQIDAFSTCKTVSTYKGTPSSPWQGGQTTVWHINMYGLPAWFDPAPIDNDANGDWRLFSYENYVKKPYRCDDLIGIKTGKLNYPPAAIYQYIIFYPIELYAYR